MYMIYIIDSYIHNLSGRNGKNLTGVSFLLACANRVGGSYAAAINLWRRRLFANVAWGN